MSFSKRFDNICGAGLRVKMAVCIVKVAGPCLSECKPLNLNKFKSNVLRKPLIIL